MKNIDMNPRKRIGSALTLLLAAALILCGCGKSTPAETTAVTETANPHEGMIEVDDGAGGLIWVPEQKGLAVSAFTRDAFAENGGFVYYTGGGYTVSQGVDVSFYQGVVDWDAVKSAGIDFAIIRCGYRGYGVGSINVDEQFEANLTGAKAAGLDVGLYFFSQAISEREAIEEARFTLALLNNRILDLPIFYDFERIGPTENGARTDNLTGEEITACAAAFCKTVKDAGYTPGVYFYRNLGYFLYDLTELKDMVFWLASPGDFPAFHYAHSYWQYTFSATIPGIGTTVDLNLRFK